jgi:multimeric flavodoxin WrbA
MARALILNGAREEGGTLELTQQVLVEELERAGVNAEPRVLREIKIRHCVGCFGCWVKTPGECMIDDAARGIAREFVRSDLVVMLTPVTFGGYSYELKKALDRIICVISPFFQIIDGEVHHKPRYDRYPDLLAVGALAAPDEESESIFTTLVGRNAINMHSPMHGAGVVYDGQGPGAVRTRVRTLLGRVELSA